MARRKAGGFSRTLDATREQKRNHPRLRDAKAALRASVLEAMTPVPVHVFDAFAGTGAMHQAVWQRAASYVGCDQEWFPDHRVAFAADNRRVMRCIDLKPFNLFDFDAFGSPWEQCLILAARRPVLPAERIGLVLTEGTNLDLSLGGLAAPLREIAGFVGTPAGLARGHGEIIERALSGLYRRMNVQPARRWETKGVTGAKVRYIGLVLEGLPTFLRQ